MRVEPLPFRHLVADGLCARVDLNEARAQWPGRDWPNWLTYDTPQQRKRTCCDWGAMPGACRRLLGQMLLLPVAQWLGQLPAVPDTLLWGAGLCDMRSGDYLRLHLDHDVHVRTGLARVATAVLYLDDFEYGWGGELQLWDRQKPLPVASFLPSRGRLVAFANGDSSYHAVAPVSCPDVRVRRALLVHWYGPPAAHGGHRPKAQFVDAHGNSVATPPRPE